MAWRIDRGELKPPRRLPDGRLIADAYLTRSGVFVYHDASGAEQREYRPPSEVFDAASLSSFALAPVTDDHPPEPLTAANARTYAVGATGEQITQDDTHIRATVAIFDAATIAKMDAGKVAVSCGYEADVEMTPGVSPDGERYDAIQRRIRGNHVAIVDCGRAGTARVRMDAWNRPTQQESKMDPKEFAAKIAELSATVEKEKSRADKAEAELAASRTALDVSTAKADSQAAELTKLRAEHKDAIDGAPARVQARVALETAARRILGDETPAEIGKLSDRDIKVAVIKHVDSAEIAADKSDVYVDARYDSASERALAADESLVAARITADGPSATAGSEQAARQTMIERNRALGTAKA